MLIQTTVSNQLEIDITDNSIISDYFVNGSTISKINPTSNSRFFVNVLINTKYYKKYINVSKTHSVLSNGNYGVYNLTASFVNSSVSITRNYNVTKSNIFFFFIKKNHFLLIFN